MDSTGRYIVRYEPSNSDHEYLQTKIEMSISDEATYDDMANFFDAFLKAAGFIYDGFLTIVKDEPKRKSYEISEPVGSVTSINWGDSLDYRTEDGYTLTGYAGVRGGMADDILKL